MLGSVTPRNDPALAAGTVISSDQPVGATLPIGASVNVVAATGRVVIIDVTGYTIDAATQMTDHISMIQWGCSSTTICSLAWRLLRS